MRFASVVLLGGLLIGLSSPIAAQSLRLSFTATVTMSEPPHSLPPIGEVVTGEVMFSQSGGTPAPNLPCGLQCQVYEFFAPYSISIDIGTRQVSRDYFQVLVGDDWTYGSITPQDNVQFGTSDGEFTYVLVLRGPIDTFSGVILPDPGVLETMTERSILDVFGGFNASLVAQLTSLQIAVVPELPPAAYLLGGSLLLLWRRVRPCEA